MEFYLRVGCFWGCYGSQKHEICRSLRYTFNRWSSLVEPRGDDDSATSTIAGIRMSLKECMHGHFILYRVNSIWINHGWGCQSCSWSTEQGKWIFPCLSPLAPEGLVPRDAFGRPVPRQPAHSPNSGWIWWCKIPAPGHKIEKHHLGRGKHTLFHEFYYEYCTILLMLRTYTIY